MLIIIIYNYYFFLVRPPVNIYKMPNGCVVDIKIDSCKEIS